MTSYRLQELVALVIVMSATASFAEEQSKIAIGPYVQNMSSESVTICWSTQEDSTTIVSPDGQAEIIPKYEQHEIRLAQLRPNTTYDYDVIGDGSPDGKGSFTTFPDKITPFRFCVIGDTRSRADVHQKIVNRIIDEKPMFVVNTGDLVSNGNVIQDWEVFFTINHQLMRSTPYFSVLGNHEKDSKHYYDFFDLPGNERYYTLSIGDALFIVLDGEGPEVSMPEYIKRRNRDVFWAHHSLEYLKKQKEWLDNMLTLHRDAGFVFVFMHEPMYSIKKSRVEGTKLRRRFWGDIFERHHVQVFLNGHDHHYHHALHGGTHYITTAGGGASLYDTDAPQPETVKFKKIEHFMTVDVGLDETVLTAIDINGEVIEEVRVLKRNR
jgi:predicted phosphodiesterase